MIIKLKTLLLEYEIFKYKKAYDSPDKATYRFTADNNLKYEVDVWHDSNQHVLGEYEAEFRVSGQKHAGHETGKNLAHLNSVLYTVADIVDEVVKDKKITKIKIEGAAGKDDMGGFMGALSATTRTKMYLRFLNNRYPNKDAIKQSGRWIYIDMTKVFPKLFPDEGVSNNEQLLNLLVKISDEDPDREGIKRGFSGIDDDNFNVDTDFVTNKKLGTIYFVIDVQKNYNEYYVEWDAYDAGTTGNESFKSFEEIMQYLTNEFL